MQFNNDWKTFLDDELGQPYYLDLMQKVELEYINNTVYPEYKNILRAFNLLTPNEVKVVIIGQDPYHGENQANGLAFSVSKHVGIPPSLRNIYKELVDDIGCGYPLNGDLTQWAEEGVLLINSVLTVIANQANSHQKLGWDSFTNSIIQKLSSKYDNIVFILWGATSAKKVSLINQEKHLILKSPHPSPLSAYRGFFGSKPFSSANNYLERNGRGEIKWCLSAQQTLL